jgi:hypothetical protein
MLNFLRISVAAVQLNTKKGVNLTYQLEEAVDSSVSGGWKWWVIALRGPSYQCTQKAE